MDFYHSERRPGNCDSGWNINEGTAVVADDDDHHHHVNYLEAQATKSKRTYDCTFCKRGFTNAQALGGHMNIHRRDRAKAVKPIVVSSDEYGSPAAVTGRCNNNYPVTMDYHVQHRQYHHQPSRGSYNNNQYLCFQQRHVAAGPRRSATVVPADGDLWGANLSLGIGSGGRKEDRELDLELRLGHID